MTGDQVSKGSDGIMIVEYEQKQGNVVPDGFNSHYLKVYYGKLFPHADIFKWMSYGYDGKHPACDQSYFSRREFSFTLENDVYLRFQSFNSVPELESSVKEKCPVKIDVGPVYSVDPAKRHAYAQSGDNVSTPVERELIFDIDMSDYDDVRYCCSGADVCLECWPLMTIAIKVIDTALRDDFGFSHILWVYSGRRGVHCWVCNGKARRRSYTGVLTEFFKKLLLSQKIFSTEERYEKILDIIPAPDQSITSELRGRWQEKRQTPGSKEDINVQGLRRWVEEIVFSFTYPRLDMEVSKHMNHLLKAPFCVQPKTGRVCVPIDPNHCEDFDPAAVPTFPLMGQNVTREINQVFQIVVFAASAKILQGGDGKFL
ncbi:unnamed protein product [Malus baccata var. baccata]